MKYYLFLIITLLSVKNALAQSNVADKGNCILDLRNNKVLLIGNDTIKNLHGTVNANLHNAIIGVTDGFEKKLEAVGVGYRFALKGNQFILSLSATGPSLLSLLLEVAPYLFVQ